MSDQQTGEDLAAGQANAPGASSDGGCCITQLPAPAVVPCCGTTAEAAAEQMATGYEQARSVVAALAGDWAAARDVHLDLPQTGVCSSNVPLDADSITAGTGGCCS